MVPWALPTQYARTIHELNFVFLFGRLGDTTAKEGKEEAVKDCLGEKYRIFYHTDQERKIQKVYKTTSSDKSI